MVSSTSSFKRKRSTRILILCVKKAGLTKNDQGLSAQCMLQYKHLQHHLRGISNPCSWEYQNFILEEAYDLAIQLKLCSKCQNDKNGVVFQDMNVHYSSQRDSISHSIWGIITDNACKLYHLLVPPLHATGTSNQRKLGASGASFFTCQLIAQNWTGIHNTENPSLIKAMHNSTPNNLYLALLAIKLCFVHAFVNNVSVILFRPSCLGVLPLRIRPPQAT